MQRVVGSSPIISTKNLVPFGGVLDVQNLHNRFCGQKARRIFRNSDGERRADADGAATGKIILAGIIGRRLFFMHGKIARAMPSPLGCRISCGTISEYRNRSFMIHFL